MKKRILYIERILTVFLIYFSGSSSINKRLAPNLRRLKITCNRYLVPLAALDQLFEQDVLFSLTKFILLASISGPHVVQNLISMLSNQCLYSLRVSWSVRTTVSLSNASSILLDTFRQLEGRVPIELELSLNKSSYRITALTVPRINETLTVCRYLDKNTVLGYEYSTSFFLITYVAFKFRQSRWPYTMRALNSRLVRFSNVIMGSYDAQTADQFVSYSPCIVSWHKITTLSIDEPLNLAQLHLIFSQTTNLRILELSCRSDFDSENDSKEQNFIDLLNDAPLCDTLMSNGLRQLNLSIQREEPDLLDIAHLIVKRFSYLQFMKLSCFSSKILEMLYILINGLSKLNFFTVHGGLRYNDPHRTQPPDPQNSITRPFQNEVYDTIHDIEMLFMWL